MKAEGKDLPDIRGNSLYLMPLFSAVWFVVSFHTVTGWALFISFSAAMIWVVPWFIILYEKIDHK